MGEAREFLVRSVRRAIMISLATAVLALSGPLLFQATFLGVTELLLILEAALLMLAGAVSGLGFPRRRFSSNTTQGEDRTTQQESSRTSDLTLMVTGFILLGEAALLSSV